MTTASRLFFIHAWTPLHAGTGQGVGSIDLPIARERATALPVVPGSSIKGCLRDAFPVSAAGDKDVVAAIFGPETSRVSEHAGALRVSDARLALLPVRSLTATFVWVTCPFVLRRLERDALACGWKKGTLPKIPKIAADEAAIGPGTQILNGRLILEEVDLGAKEAPDAGAWADWFGAAVFARAGDDSWKAELRKRFAIVSDEVFTFLSEFATEVNAHIRIEDKRGTVDRGALWYQETLPAETVLVSVIQSGPSLKSEVNLKGPEILDQVASKLQSIQPGGQTTTGLGVAGLSFLAPGGAAK